MRGETRGEKLNGIQTQDRNVSRHMGKQTQNTAHVTQRQVSSRNRKVLMVGADDDSNKHEKKYILGGQIRRGENR
jgi:hypothetical protein